MPPSRFAIVELSGSQHKVTADDVICVEKLALPVGAELAARRVLLVGELGSTIIGSPLIKGACVHATVEEQGYGKKVIVFKKRRRKGYRRWNGYRSRLTMLRIRQIECALLAAVRAMVPTAALTSRRSCRAHTRLPDELEAALANAG